MIFNGINCNSTIMININKNKNLNIIIKCTYLVRMVILTNSFSFLTGAVTWRITLPNIPAAVICRIYLGGLVAGYSTLEETCTVFMVLPKDADFILRTDPVSAKITTIFPTGAELIYSFYSLSGTRYPTAIFCGLTT